MSVTSGKRASTLKLSPCKRARYAPLLTPIDIHWPLHAPLRVWVQRSGYAANVQTWNAARTGGRAGPWGTQAPVRATSLRPQQTQGLTAAIGV